MIKTANVSFLVGPGTGSQYAGPSPVQQEKMTRNMRLRVPIRKAPASILSIVHQSMGTIAVVEETVTVTGTAT